MTNFDRHGSNKDGRRSICKQCQSKRYAANANKDPYFSRFRYKKADAKKRGIEFTLVYEDMEWPELCPVLGIKLDYSYGNKNGVPPNSPSFDRIDPSKGYVPGNVIVVSQLANTIKTNATIEQIERVASFYRQLIPHVGAHNV